MKTFEKGNITELQVQLELVKKGYLVFTPVNDGSFVDLVVKLNSGYKSVQVKSAAQTQTGFMIYLYSTAGGGKKKYYSPETLDYFATFFNGKTYLIPVTEVVGIGRLVLRTNTTYRNQNKAFHASSYELP
jgi:hypothetical protein